MSFSDVSSLDTVGAPSLSILPKDSKFTCKQCFEACALVDSTPVGKDPFIRLEKCCNANRRNMERRVQKRPERDELRTFWKALVVDKSKLAAWSRKMKQKRRNEHFEVSMDIVEEEKKRFESSKKRRMEFYGFQTLEDENPDMSKEDLQQLWEKKVSLATRKIEENGELFIARPKTIIFDETESISFEAGIKRQKTAQNAEGLERAYKDSSEAMGRFMQVQHQELQSSSPSKKAVEASQDLDWITNNVSAAMERSLKQDFSLRQATRDLRLQAQEEEKQDAENFADEQLFKVKRAEEKNNTDTIPKQLAKLKLDFQPMVIQKFAKLEATHIDMANQAVMPDNLTYEHLGDNAPEVQVVLQNHLKAATGECLKFTQQIDNFKKDWSEAEKTLSTAGLEDAKKLVTNFLEEYQDFFKIHQTPFRRAMKGLKASAAEVMKGAKKHTDLHCKGQNTKHKALTLQAPKDVPPLATSVSNANNNAFEDLGTEGLSNSMDDFPERPCLLDPKVDVAKILTWPQCKIMCAWADKQLKGDASDTYIIAQIVNKKFNEDVGKALHNKVDRQLSQGKCSLKFPAPALELKAALFGYHMGTFAAQHFQLNVLHYCLPQVMLALSGKIFVLGVHVDDIPGDHIGHKSGHIAQMDLKSVCEQAKRRGFYCLMDAGKLLTLPPRHIIVMYALETTRVIRWSMFAEEHRSGVKADIQSIMTAHEFLQNTDYARLYEIVATEP